MKTIIITGSKLALICAVAAVALGFVNSVTAPKIEEIKQQKLEQALSTVVKEGKAGSETMVPDNKTVGSYYPINKDGKVIGYILRLVGTGYGGDMHILASFDTEGTVLAAVLMENEETPGLGKEAENIEYMEKYLGTGNEEPVPVSKKDLPAEQAEAVSGATITFSGIGKALAAGSEFVTNLGGGQ